jgi:REP element-mobilizing transposase RayT
MSRDLRTLLPDGIYHAYSRGTGPMVIYRDDEDYAAFTRMLRKAERLFSWKLIAYCLMPTHYHVVLEVKVDDLSNGMQRLNSSYAHYFNRRHGRTGALFQGRFRTRLVDTDEYLDELCAYVPFNPVRAGHCERPQDWPWRWSLYAL